MNLTDFRRAVVLAEELHDTLYENRGSNQEQMRYLISDTESVAKRLRGLLRDTELAKLESFKRAAVKP
jgi:hypothetical protein